MGTKFQSYCFSPELFVNVSTTQSLCNNWTESEVSQIMSTQSLVRQQIRKHIGESFLFCPSCDHPAYPNEEIIYNDRVNLYLGVCSAVSQN